MREGIAVALVACILGLSGMSADTTASAFSLSVNLDSRYYQGLTICTTVRPGEPFNETWSHENMPKQHYRRAAGARRGPLTLTVDQHLTDSKTGSSTMQGYKLELGTWKTPPTS